MLGVACGYTEDQIAELIDPRLVIGATGMAVPAAGSDLPHKIPVNLLRARFAQELEHGDMRANARVAANLFSHATGNGRDAVRAAIAWLTSRAGWKFGSSGVTITPKGPSDGNQAVKPGEQTVSFTLKLGDRGENDDEA